MLDCNTLELLSNLRDALSDRLKEFREKVGWTQHDLAAACGMSAEGIRGYEQKRRWPDPEELEKMANALSVRAIDLLMLKEDLRPHSPDQALQVLADYIRANELRPKGHIQK